MPLRDIDPYQLTNGLGFSGSKLVPIERVTSGLPVIDTNHGQIHAGNAFSLKGEMTILQSKLGVFEFTIPAGAYVHLQGLDFSANAGPTVITFLEDAALTSAVGATTLAPINHHRVTPTASEVVVKALADAAVTNGGAVVTLGTFPIYATGQGVTRVSADTSSPEEYILKPATKYVLAITNSFAGTIKVAYRLFWYEEGGA